MNKYRIDDLIEVEIARIVPRGFGIAFLENLTVFVPLSAPQDRLRVRIKELKGKIAFAEIDAVINPSSSRIDPTCKYYGTCGGCDFQHLAYAAQIAAKRDLILDSLKRIGSIEFRGDFKFIECSEPFGYRSKVRWHAEVNEKSLGYYKRGTEQLVDIDSCPILVDSLERYLSQAKANLPWDRFWNTEVELEAAASSAGDLSVYCEEFEPPRELLFDYEGIGFMYSAETFFQANLTMIPSLIEAAIDGASGEFAVDLYSGVGLFTLPLSRRFNRIIGVEDVSQSVEFAQQSADIAGLNNVEFIESRVRRFLSHFGGNAPDFILLDPPRSGTEKGVIEKIAQIGAKNITYVACDPPMLARDLKHLVGAGYQLSSLTALDLFPQTHHVETVARLIRD